MTLIPQSLFGRIALLILAVLLLSHTGAFVFFRVYNADTRAQHRADALAAQVQVVTGSLDVLDGAEREAFISKMLRGDNIRLLPDQAAPPGLASPRAAVRELAEALSARLGYSTEVRLQRGSLWIRAESRGGRYWVMLPRREPAHPLQWQLLGNIALMALMALLGASLIVWRINRPLRHLTEAVSLVGRGETPHPLEETGPAEIRTLSRAFNQMAQDLERLEADRALLLAGISHDLRTPLSRLRLGLEMVDEKIDADLREGLAQDIEDIDAVVEQFLAYVRGDGGEPVEERGDLNRIAAAVAERYGRMGKAVKLGLSPLPALALRPTSTQRLVTNLVDNALRYAGNEVEIRTAVEGGRVVLRVLDRGPGIPDKDFARMLQPFTRLDPARGGKGGAGLGLAIVNRIARLHGGDVRLAARPGGGLEVAVSF